MNIRSSISHNRLVHKGNEKQSDNVKALSDILGTSQTIYLCKICGKTNYSNDDRLLHTMKFHGQNSTGA